MDKNSRIIITGGFGFVGKNLVNVLNEFGYTNVCPISHSEYDLKNKYQTSNMYEDIEPDIVFNLASRVGGIGFNKDKSGELFYDNLLIGMNIIDEARKYGKLEKFIQVGTTCSYAADLEVPFKEDDLYKGLCEPTNRGYGFAKLSLMQMIECYRKQYNFPGINIIPGNMYGKYDHFEPEKSHIIPACIVKILNAKENKDDHVSFWGTGNATRDMLYVEDACEGLVLAMERYNGDLPINLGNGKEYTIKKIVNMIADSLCYREPLLFNLNDLDGQKRRCLDITRAKDLLGWFPKTTLPIGIEKTVNWYLSNRTA